MTVPLFATRELGRAAREEAERQRQLLEEGHKIYLDYCTQGEDAIKEKLVSADYFLLM